ncbi:multiple sugar transport system ATP-binding protein [Devosia sp. UYZn731]|uniref:ABC transporter ATP-binding protein n=1 Tax=Devosia sp. UYZn731 TaxID=3156345 RepID=UPI00339B2307
MAGLQLSNVRKNYGKVEVIKGIDLAIEHGEFVVFVGPSGCGKSTLLRMIAGLEEITDGELFIGKRKCNEVAPRDRGVAMVFQSYALYPHMTVEENVGFGLRLSGVPKAERAKRVREVAKILQMEELLERKPSQLSGGQRQRVAIGRAIIRQPEVFLFDEPLSNLDAALRVDMRMELSKLHTDLGATMIYVTHDQVEAMTMADKIVVLNFGEVQQVGTPMELYNFPANLFVAGFIGAPKMNLLPVTVDAVSGDAITVSAPSLKSTTLHRSVSGLTMGDTLTFGIRPHLLVPDADGPITGKIRLIERLGDSTVVEVDGGAGGTIFAAIDGDIEVQLEQFVSLGLDETRAHLFGPDGNRL